MYLVSSSTDTGRTWKKSRFILSEKTDFPLIDNLPISVKAFAKSMLASLSVDEILYLNLYVNWSIYFRYVSWFINFRGLPIKEKIAPLLFETQTLFLGGARGVLVIVVGNGHGDTSSNPGLD